MGLKVNKAQLEEILGISQRTLSDWQTEAGFPIEHRAEVRGEAHVYDTAAVIGWWLQRELGRSAESGKARQRLVLARAASAELELARQSGQLVSAAAVALEAQKVAREVRDRMLGISSRLAPLLANMTSPQEIDQVVDREIREVLKGLHEHLLAYAQTEAAPGLPALANAA